MRRSLKIAGLAVLVVLTAGAIAVAGMLWRLNQGPVSLAFIKDRIEATINDTLPDVSVSVGNVIVERDHETGRPRFRLQDIALLNDDGQLLARAPRASIVVSSKDLLSGRLVPRELELIGASILARRTAAGGLELGFGQTTDGRDKTTPGVTVSGKADRSDTADILPSPFDDGQVADIIDVLDREILSGDQGRLLSRLDAIRISRATISLYDALNGAVWYSPKANVVFRRMPYGYAVFADASVATRHEPWRTELVANYRRSDKSFDISARIFDLVPANIAEHIFALSQFAEISLPLSGHAEFTIDSGGKLKSGSAELSTAAGKVGFPGYISDPIVVDEGLLRLDYEPATGDVVIGNSAIFVGGSQAQLSGRLKPMRGANARITGLGIELDAGDVAIDATGNIKDAVAFDRIAFKGVASLVEARLDVEDLVLLSGNAGVRLRGSFVGGDEAVGIYVSGLMRDISSRMLKTLWPPIVAEGTREWIEENVRGGRITEGEFQLAIPANLLADALNGIPMPDEVVSVDFRLEDVTATYLDNMPPVTGGVGKGRLTGNSFTIEAEKAQISVDGGRKIDIAGSTMTSSGLAAPVTPAEIDVRATGRAEAFAALADRKPFELMKQAGVPTAAISGDAVVRVKVALPLSEELKADDIAVSASVKLENAGFKGVADGIDLANGEISLDITDARIAAKGPAELNGLPVKLDWERQFNKNRDIDSLTLTATLDDERRKEFGIDLAPYLTGPVSVKVTSKGQGDGFDSFDIEADLSKTTAQVAEVDWYRVPTAKTTGSMTVRRADGVVEVSGLRIAGDGFQLEGDLLLDKAGDLRRANFSKVVLGGDNVFQARITSTDGALAFDVAGQSFDARPLMRDMFAGSGSPEQPGSKPPVTVTMALDRLIANRGEVLSRVTGTLSSAAGSLQYADVKGTFASGAPMSIRIRPGAQGVRQLQVTGRDAGAALRAANLYSKISGGLLDFSATLARPGRGSIERGRLVIRNFEVRNEDRLADFDQPAANQRSANRGGIQAAGPRNNGRLAFSKLTLPFSVDNNFVRIGDALVKGTEIGASANGVIRKADGAMDIGGTIIPAYALNAAISEVPLFGQILTGGKGQGVFGLNFALKGTMSEPRFLVNPVSAIAPGFLRQMFQIGGGGVASDGTAAAPAARRKTNSNR